MTNSVVALVIDQERVGDLIPVGDHLVLYTARPDLAGLDGLSYDCAYDAEVEVRAILHGRGRGIGGRHVPPDED